MKLHGENLNIRQGGGELAWEQEGIRIKPNLETPDYTIRKCSQQKSVDTLNFNVILKKYFQFVIRKEKSLVS